MFKNIFKKDKNKKENKEQAHDDCPMCKIDPSILAQLKDNSERKEGKIESRGSDAI